MLALVSRLYWSKGPCEANPSIGYNLVKPIVEGSINIKTCSKKLFLIFPCDTHLVGISGKKERVSTTFLKNAHSS